uniref:Uncharacterized protein n=1 Tax=Candidatus Magnetobacterium bavaricum TaxID=29290 RepID=D7GXE6_9BACT|nr:hypothetical protein mtbajb2F00025 [Candidatus Magnetobacterium bavaricum]
MPGLPQTSPARGGTSAVLSQQGVGKCVWHKSRTCPGHEEVLLTRRKLKSYPPKIYAPLLP